jgi:ribosomal protein S18 acetylase RimI-like enzyme
MTPRSSNTAVAVRGLRPTDLDDVVALDAALTHERKESYWQEVLARFLARRGGLALGVDREDGAEGLDGYLCGEVRAFEFGSEPCGWVFSLGVRPEAARHGIASALLAEARARFARYGVTRIRTMVTRTDVPMLSVFRSQGFVGGPFVQLELDISGPTITNEETP